MTDIVERLRERAAAYSPHAALLIADLREAAGEIERLRELVSGIESWRCKRCGNSGDFEISCVGCGTLDSIELKGKKNDRTKD